MRNQFGDRQNRRDGRNFGQDRSGRSDREHNRDNDWSPRRSSGDRESDSRGHMMDRDRGDISRSNYSGQDFNRNSSSSVPNYGSSSSESSRGWDDQNSYGGSRDFDRADDRRRRTGYGDTGSSMSMGSGIDNNRGGRDSGYRSDNYGSGSSSYGDNYGEGSDRHYGGGYSYGGTSSSRDSSGDYDRSGSGRSTSSNRSSSDYGSGIGSSGYGSYGSGITGGFRTPRYEGGRSDMDRDNHDQSFFEKLGEKVGEFFGKGPKGYRRSDDRVREDISEALYRHPYIDASEIEVTVSEGMVTLSGMVPDRQMKRLIEDEVEKVSGVRDVQNSLRLSSSTYGSSTDSSSLSTSGMSSGASATTGTGLGTATTSGTTGVGASDSNTSGGGMNPTGGRSGSSQSTGRSSGRVQ